MHSNDMYTEEQYRETLAKIQAQPKKVYTEDSVDNTRKAWNDAKDHLERVQNGEFSFVSISELRQRVRDAEATFEDALKNASGLAARKRERAVQAKREELRAIEQAVYAEKTRIQWETQTREKFIAAGGTPYEWELAQDDLWQQELARRVQSEQDTSRIRANVRGAF
jgi:hypothetical protein